jgi:iron complex outermembrane receptor protein
MTLLFDNLTVGVNLGILDDEIDSFRGTLVSSGITITKSNDLPFTPDWTLSLTAAYDIPLPNGAAIALRSDYAIKDDYYTAIENIEETLEDNYRVLNASIRYISADELWSVGIMGRNVTDEDFFQSRTIFDSFQLGFGQPIRPRTVSAFFEYNF